MRFSWAVNWKSRFTRLHSNSWPPNFVSFFPRLKSHTSKESAFKMLLFWWRYRQNACAPIQFPYNCLCIYYRFLGLKSAFSLVCSAVSRKLQEARLSVKNTKQMLNEGQQVASQKLTHKKRKARFCCNSQWRAQNSVRFSWALNWKSRFIRLHCNSWPPNFLSFFPRLKSHTRKESAFKMLLFWPKISSKCMRSHTVSL